MKAELNTLENKAKFFAQYWGQKVGCFSTNQKAKIQESYFEFITYLELKPLSSISDEDATYVGYDTKEQAVIIFKAFKDFDYRDVDYLRSKGYALDWNGITVEKQIQFGWVKIKD